MPLPIVPSYEALPAIESKTSGRTNLKPSGYGKTRASTRIRTDIYLASHRVQFSHCGFVRGVGEMEYRYSDEAEYPRRGRYGDTTQRCAWCGKPTTYGDRFCVGGMFRRNYCSFTCRGAGDYYSLIALALIWSMIMMSFVWLLPDFFSKTFLVIYMGVLPTLCLWSWVLCGRSERRACREQ